LGGKDKESGNKGLATSRSPVQNHIVIIGAAAAEYKPFLHASEFPDDVACPACGRIGLKFHSRYSKYHRDQRIDIVRGLCPGCGITHALIPSFSLPNSSHDSGDVERHLAGRAAGRTRRESGAHILAAGRSLRVLKGIERSFERCMRNWSAIFAMVVATRQAFETLAAVVVAKACAVEERAGVLLAANHYALQRGVNAVFASRSSILLFRARKAGVTISHNLASPRDAPAVPDSS
jgi:hypothetical protein